MDFNQARFNMVENQVRANGVTDPLILEAMESLPRERFVPSERQGIAYMDDDVPLGEGRSLMAPMVLARLIEAAGVRSGEMAMVVGCATGYSAAVLARLAGGVVGVESERKLIDRAGVILSDLGIDTVALVEGPLAEGCAKDGPYDVILFDGAVGEIPEAISGQLAEGGRILAMMAGSEIARGTLVTRFGGHLAKRNLFEAGALPLPGFFPEPTFTF